MMYVKHFVTCKALCTCVGDCSHYGHYYLTVGAGALSDLHVGQGLGHARVGHHMDFQRICPGQLPSGDHKLCLMAGALDPQGIPSP